MARQALESVPVLPLEQIDNKTVIALLIDLPFLLGSHFGRQRFQSRFSLGRHLDGRWRFLHSIQVLVQTVQDEREELLRIVLFVGRRELGCEAHDRSLWANVSRVN